MTVTNQIGSTSEFSFSSINGAHVDQGMHLESSDSDQLKAAKSVIVVGQTLSATDIVKINQPISQSIALARPEESKKRTAGSKTEPTGTVFFEDGDTIIGHSKVKVVRGVAEAQAKLKLTNVGPQTIYALYDPDAEAMQNGFTASYTSMTITVDPKAAKKGSEKSRGVVVGSRPQMRSTDNIPAGPRALAHRSSVKTTRQAPAI